MYVRLLFPTIVSCCMLFAMHCFINYVPRSKYIKLSSRAKGPVIVVPLLSHTNLPLVAHCCSLYIKYPIVYIVGVSCPCTRALGF